MIIKQPFDVAVPIDQVWKFFDNVPQVAASMPGARLTEQREDGSFTGTVAISAGPVKLLFDGVANIHDRDEAAKTLVLDADASDKNGLGAIQLKANVRLVPKGGTATLVDLAMDLVISGQAAQFGTKAMIANVSSVIMGQFADNMQARIIAISEGRDPDSVGSAKSASGATILMKATSSALKATVARFFAPYPHPEIVQH